MDEEIKKKIFELCEGRVEFHVPMKEHTSMKVGGKADCLAFPPSVLHLARLVSFLSEEGIPYLPGGNWTNVIVRDGGVRDVLISLAGLRELRWLERRGDHSSLYAEAGVPLRQLVHTALQQEMEGLEFCVGIPGSVGGAIKMNAGAWGREMKDVLERVWIMDERGQTREMITGDLSFRYRSLEISPSEIIVGASFRLIKGIRKEIEKRLEEMGRKRKERHPLEYPSAGSIFKNPALAPAGRLIEEAGLKGKQIGGARISEKHGNFIVNTGQATATDVIKLIDLIKMKVKEHHGVTLETEVAIIGEDQVREEKFERP